jgi:hypothetical protein
MKRLVLPDVVNPKVPQTEEAAFAATRFAPRHS